MKIFHFDIPSPTGNFGDDILFYSTKRAFEKIFYDRKVQWISYPLRHHTTDNVIRRANDCDLIVVGGGGLLLKDTAPNSYSGWEWVCSIDHLSKIEKPLVIFSIGYNRFRGQEEFDPIFKEHLRASIEKSSFFCMRESAACKIVAQQCEVPEENLHFNPCPSLFYEVKQKAFKKTGNIGINLAGDRAAMRFNPEVFYHEMEEFVGRLVAQGYNVYFFNHNWNPHSNCQEFIDRIPRKKIYDIETIWNKRDLDRAVNFYKSMDLVIAMRSHAQIVPFGQGVKVLSLITHDKLRWFLEDMEMTDTGVDILDGNLCERLLEKVDWILGDKGYRERNKEAMIKMRHVFARNGEKIRELCPNI